MKHGSLFSGVGGFDLAAEWMGWENVFHCEWNTFGQKVLKYYWPKSITYNDITQTDFSIHRGKIDILTGGFPCQPYSTAGKRLGKGDSRHLWPEMLRAIREIEPRWIVGENVRGLISWNGGMVFDEVQSELEAAGYSVRSFVLPAAGVNAPHRRERVWFVAKNTRSDGRLFGESHKEGAEIWKQRDFGAGDTERICREEMAGIAADTDNTRTNIGMRSERKREESDINGRLTQPEFGSIGGDGNATNASSSRLEADDTMRKPKGSFDSSGNSGEIPVADTEQPRLQGQHREWEGCSEHRVDEGVFVEIGRASCRERV